MIHIKEYKIFESDENIRDIIHECFIPVEDLTNVTVEINKSTSFDHAIIKIFELNEDICEEITNAVSHCIGMGLYFIGSDVYYRKEIYKEPIRMFTTTELVYFNDKQVEEFYNFITSGDLQYNTSNRIRKMKIEFRRYF